jgi:hypothetical protein
MIKYLFALLLLVHGLIHLIGFSKAFDLAKITQLTKPISKTSGLFWLVTTLLFVLAALLFLLKKESWLYFAATGLILSQLLILTVWKDARFGTIANCIILAFVIAYWGNQSFEKEFTKDVTHHLESNNTVATDLLTENDLQQLPTPVQKYLRYCGAINQPKLKNVQIVFDGEMREKGKDWFPFQSTQYNFTSEPARLFFMKAKMFGTTVPGYHHYEKGNASMEVKLFGLFPMVSVRGGEMNRAETVTIFNDMCLMYPASLIDSRIKWEPINDTSAQAQFTNKNILISATLFFNDSGQLVNFISDDRYAVSEKKRYRFSTPVKDYVAVEGRKLPSYGEAIWHYPDGEFVYGKFRLKSIRYNVNSQP